MLSGSHSVSLPFVVTTRGGGLAAYRLTVARRFHRMG